MKIIFRTKRLAKQCQDELGMWKKQGTRSGRKLAQRMMELRVATSLDEISHLPPPRCHALTGDRKGQFSVDLAHPYRLLFVPANDPLPLLEDGSLDRSRVTEIEIVDIVDTH